MAKKNRVVIEFRLRIATTKRNAKRVSEKAHVHLTGVLRGPQLAETVTEWSIDSHTLDPDEPVSCLR